MLKYITVVAAILFHSALSIGAAFAQDAHPAEFQITNSEVRTIESTMLDRSYDLYVKLPPGYNAPENADRKYPVIFFNDGGYCWLTAVGVTRAPFNLGGYEDAILVGFSYAKGERGVASRIRDYTPTNNPAWRKFTTGGAKAYLSFIRDEAIPFIAAQYRTAPERRMIVGHSLGGLFGAYALIEEPELFSDYILTSPSLWFHDEVIFEMEQAAAEAGSRLKGRVFLAIGATETPSVNGGPHDMRGQTVSFANLLRSRGYDALAVKDVVYDGSTHLTTFPVGFTEAMRWMLPGEDIYGG